MNQSQKTMLMMLGLLAVAGAFGGYAYFGVFKKDQASERRVEHELRLFAPQKLDERQADGGSPPAEFTHLTVTTGGHVTTLERRGNREWWIVSPVVAKADKLVVDGITSQLQTAKFKATLEEDPDAATLQKYGLDAPAFVVVATAQVGAQDRTVKIIGGIENTFDGSVYVRRNDEKPVFTAEGGVRFMLAKQLFDLRDKNPFAVDEAKLQRLAVKSGANEYEVVRLNDKQWNLVRPAAEPADSAALSAIIAGTSQERAQAFPDDSPAQRKALGFDAPLIDARLTLTGDKVVHLRVTRQAPDGGEEAFYGLREDDDGAVLAKLGSNVTQYDRPPSDLRDKTVLRFRRELVTKIVFHDPAGEEVVVQKDSVDASADAWRVVAPRPGKAKVFKVTGALWTLGSFKALVNGEEKPKDWGRYGLDAKAKFIALYGQDGAELARLVIGKEVIGKPVTFYVRGTRDQVLESEGSRFGELPFALGDVLDEPGADAGPAVTSP